MPLSPPRAARPAPLRVISSCAAIGEQMGSTTSRRSSPTLPPPPPPPPPLFKPASRSTACGCA